MADTIGEGGGNCPPQAASEDETTYCANHPSCCVLVTVVTDPPNGTVRQILVNPNRRILDVEGSSGAIWELPAWRVLTRGIVQELDPATIAGFRTEFTALADRFAGDQLVQAQAQFFADRGMVLHQQAVLSTQPNNTAYVLERAELLHNAGFHRPAIRLANSIIERSDEQAPEDRAQLAAALEIGGRSLQALDQRKRAKSLYARSECSHGHGLAGLR